MLMCTWLMKGPTLICHLRPLLLSSPGTFSFCQTCLHCTVEHFTLTQCYTPEGTIQILSSYMYLADMRLCSFFDHSLPPDALTTAPGWPSFSVGMDGTKTKIDSNPTSSCVAFFVTGHCISRDYVVRPSLVVTQSCIAITHNNLYTITNPVQL